VFAKLQFPGRQALYWSVMASIMVPGTVLVLPIYLLASQLNIINTAWGVILPSLASPFGVFLMRVFIEQSIPSELLESARIDGAGELRIVISVVLPLVAPGFATAFLFAFVAAWNNYFLPLVMLNNPKLFTLTLGLASWNGRAGVPGAELLYTVVIIGALVSTLPLIVAFLFLQRYWRSGLTMGSVKL
jgi:multiple sugar transport system permease protein